MMVSLLLIMVFSLVIVRKVKGKELALPRKTIEKFPVRVKVKGGKRTGNPRPVVGILQILAPSSPTSGSPMSLQLDEGVAPIGRRLDLELFFYV